MRNIWISGLIQPKLVSNEVRNLFYAGRLKDFPKGLIEFHDVLTEFSEQFRKFYGEEEATELYKRLTEEDYHVEGSKQFCGLFPVDFYEEVQLGLTSTFWKDCKINIIDTFKHVDFTIDVQRALHFFDGAILVLSSVSGVHMKSTDVDQHMKSYEIPRLVFIDKLDKKGANPWVVLNQARSKLGHHCATIQVPIGLEGDFQGLVDLVQLKAYFFQCDNVVAEEVPADMEALVLDKRRELIETVSEVDGELAEAFHCGKTISSAVLEEAVRRATIARKFIPVLMGSAFKKGPQPLLDGVLRYLPCPSEVSKYALDKAKDGVKVYLHESPDKPLVASVVTFKAGFLDGLLTTCLRIYEGVLREGDCIVNVRTGEKKWVHRLLMHDGKDIQEARAGQIIMVYNDDKYSKFTSPICAPGDTFIGRLVNHKKPPMNVRENVSKDFEGNENRESHKNIYTVHQDLMKLLSKHVHEK